MNEQQVEQIERLAERLGLDGVAELCADWRALKAENERLRVAGLALAEFAEDYDPENEITCCQVLGCYGGRNHRSEGGEREHATDCPTRAFVQP